MGGCILGVVDPSCASGSSLRIRLSASSFKAMRWCTCGTQKIWRSAVHKTWPTKTKKNMTGWCQRPMLPGSKMIKSYLDHFFFKTWALCINWGWVLPKNGHISSKNSSPEHRLGTHWGPKREKDQRSIAILGNSCSIATSDLAKRQEQTKTNV